MSQSSEIDKAKELLRHKKVSRLRDKNIDLHDHFQVIGSKNEKYLVILPNFCTCMHFHINCIKDPESICKHILACKLSGDNIPITEIDNWQHLLFQDF